MTNVTARRTTTGHGRPTESLRPPAGSVMPCSCAYRVAAPGGQKLPLAKAAGPPTARQPPTPSVAPRAERPPRPHRPDRESKSSSLPPVVDEGADDGRGADERDSQG